MYTEVATKLIREAKRAQNLQNLPPYASQMVQDIIREINQLAESAAEMMEEYEALKEANENNPDYEGALESEFAEKERQMTCALVVKRLCIFHNKRCVLAYAAKRAQRIAEMVWNDRDPQDPTNLYNLSVPEQDYFNIYNDLVTAHKGKYSEIDLSGPLDPPKDLFVDVRVLKDAGEIQTEYGVFNLTKNSQFYVRHADVFRLIQQGYLQQI